MSDSTVGIYGRLDRLKANSSMISTSFDLELIAVFGLIYLDSFAGLNFRVFRLRLKYFR